jgi:ubiquinone/menaquinone biosynthesis C-methylase UbiE
VVSTTSFDHWADQRAGLAQCARVLAPGGCLVLADLFSVLLLPTLLAGRRDKARTRRRATRLVTAAGLRSPQWHRLYAVIVQAVMAIK